MLEFTVLLGMVMAAWLFVGILFRDILKRLLRDEDYTDYRGG